MKFADVKTVAFAVRWNTYGTLLCCMPLILQWKKIFPQTSVTLVVSDSNAPLVPYLQGYDHIKVIPHSLKSLWKEKKKADKPLVDLAVSCFPRYSIEMDAILWTLNAKQKISPVKNAFLNPFRRNPVYEHQLKERTVHHGLACLKILFPEFEEVPEDLFPRLILPKKKNLPVNAELQNLLEYDDSPLILISASNNREYCFLGVNGYADIINALYSQRGCRVIISSLERDIIYAQALSNQLAAPSCVVCTPVVGDLLQIIGRTDLVFVGDGGLMHMAAALDKFQVALFKTRKVVRWSPLSKKAICLDHPEHVIKIPKVQILEALLKQLDKIRQEKHANR